MVPEVAMAGKKIKKNSSYSSSGNNCYIDYSSSSINSYNNSSSYSSYRSSSS